MFNVNINQLSLWKIKQKGYFFEFGEKRITLRTLTNKPLFELIYDEEENCIIVLNRDVVYYSSSLEINVNEKDEITLKLNLEEPKLKIVSVNGKEYPVIYVGGKKANVTIHEEAQD